MSDHPRSGLPENIAAFLSYGLGWITGLVFLLVDKRAFVRFHAAQSVIVFLGLQIVEAVLGPIFGLGWWFGGGGYWSAFTFGTLLLNLISFLTPVLWIVLMLRAFQGVRFKVPLAGDIAESLAGRAA